ncbi:MAG: glycosyltransferase family 1 protein [Acidobacteriota bacterium]
MTIALDATYSLGRNLSGVGVYSREILFGLARAHPDQRFKYYYRPHRLLRSFKEPIPGNASRRLLTGVPRAELFHALNQRVVYRAKRTVSTFHDLFVMSGEYSTQDFRARFTQQAKDAAERSDLIIAVSQFTADQVESLLKVERSRIRVVHHGVHVPAVLPQAPRENIILFVGAIQARKNIVRLVKAFERMGTHGEIWRLILAGATDGFGSAEALAAIAVSPKRSNIDVLGYVSSEQLEALYARASIFAFPSLDEGFGMPVLDAMARGVPVLTSSSSALPEVAGDAALRVDPTRMEGIAMALSLLANDQELREDLARRGHARAAEFSWDRAVASTWAAYQECAGKVPGGQHPRV